MNPAETMNDTKQAELTPQAANAVPRKHNARGPSAAEWKKVHRHDSEGGARMYVDAETWREALILAGIDPDTPLDQLRVKFNPAAKNSGRQARIMVTIRFNE